MGLFSKTPRVQPAELAALRHELAELRIRLDATELSKANLELQLHQLELSTSAFAARAHTIDDVSTRMAELDVLKREIAELDVVNSKSLDGVAGQMADLADRMTATAEDAKQAKDQAAALHQRIADVSNELTNQLGELSGEIDGLAQSKSSPAEPVVAEQPISTEVIEQLHVAQVRLANEQARYEIAFRQDLATLAELVKRARTER